MNKIELMPSVNELAALTNYYFDESRHVEMAQGLVKKIVPYIKTSTIPGGERTFDNSGNFDIETLQYNFGENYILFPSYVVSIKDGIGTARLDIEYRVKPSLGQFQETHIIYRKSDLSFFALQKRNILSVRLKDDIILLISRDYENLWISPESNWFQRILL